MWASYCQGGEGYHRKQELESIRGTLSPRSFKDTRARFHQGRTPLRPSHLLVARRKHRPLIHGLLLAIIVMAAASATILGSRVSPKAHAFSSPVTGLSMPGVGSSIPASQDLAVTAPPITQTNRVEQPVPTQAQEVAAALVMLSTSPTEAAPTTTPAADEGAAVRAAAVAAPPDLPAYRVYKVKDGDTLSSIAAEAGIDPAYITANNPEILNADFLQLGQSIIIPAGNGILHEVHVDETLSSIAAYYNVDVSAITSFAANHIDDPNNIQLTQYIFVPGAQIPAPIPAAAPAPSDQTGGGGDGAPAPEPQPTPVPAPPADSGGSSGGGGGGGGAPSSGGLIWPVVGPISSCYCPWHPLGIDIDGFNLAGAPIAAATDGTVVFAGGNACCSYGLYVVIMSPSGIQTLYGHLSSIAVSQGEQVSQGETIGIIGSTGYSTGRHLHFEVIDNGVRQNPLDYLPSGAVCEAGQRC